MSCSDKHVRFAKCYTAICIPTGEKRLKFIELKHEPSFDEMDTIEQQLFMSRNKRHYNQTQTAAGLMSKVYECCTDQIGQLNPEKFMKALNNIINDAPTIVHKTFETERMTKRNNLFNINYNYTYRHNDCIGELKQMAQTLFVSLNDKITTYYSDIRKLQQPFKQFAMYLNTKDLSQYRKIYHQHSRCFVRPLSNIIIGYIRNNTADFDKNVNDIINNMQTIINDPQYVLSQSRIDEIHVEIANSEIYEMFKDIDKRLYNHLPSNKIWSIIKFITHDHHKECIAYEIIEELDIAYHFRNDDGSMVSVADILNAIKEYNHKHNNNPLRPRIYPGGGGLYHHNTNYNI